MSVVKKLAGQTAVYGLSSIIGRLLNYLLVPLYTGVMSTKVYGVSSWFYAFASFAAVVFTYGMETAFFRFAHKKEDKVKVFSTIMNSIIVSSLVFGFLIYYFATPIAHISKNDGRESFFYYFAIVLAADAISAIPFAWLRLQNEAARFALLKLLSIATNIGLNIFFYVIAPFLVSKGLFAPLDPDGEVSIKWMFIANVMSSVVVLPFFTKELSMIRAGFDKEMWKEMIIYSFPLIFMGFAGMINETLDRILLKLLIVDQNVAEAQTGIYSANYKLSILITLFIQAFRFAAEPFFFARAKEGDAQKVYANVMKYFTIVCATIFLLVLLYLDIFKYFLRNPVYWQGLKVVPILLMANVFLGMYYNLSIWYKLTDKTRLGAIVSIAGAAITLILNWLWIPQYGYLGSAWATLICYFFMAVMSYALGQKYYPVPYQVRRIVSYLALSMSIYIISDILKEELGFSTIINLLLNTVLFALYLFIIYKMEEKELNKMFGDIAKSPMGKKILRLMGKKQVIDISETP